MRATGLRCEYRTDPVGIGELRPRLSWTLESDRRADLQTGYRIVAAPSLQELTARSNVQWDTGDVGSDRSVGVPWEGRPLASRTSCAWQVAVRDSSGTWSAFSEPASFEIGLVAPSDWQAQWIRLGEAPDRTFDPPTGQTYDEWQNSVAASPYLRRSFRVRGAVRRARVYATARGVYELHLNGARVGRDVLAPGWTDYNVRLHHQTCDVGALLREGENVLGAILGDGWYAGCVGFDAKRRGAHYGSHPQLLAQLELEYDDGSRETIVSDGSWEGTTGPILYSDLLLGEHYDARLEMPGWSEPGSDGAGWYPVAAGPAGGPDPAPQPDEGVRVTGEVTAVSVSEPEPGRFIFDLGQNIAGRVRLRARGEAGTAITLRHAEVLNPDGTLYTENLRFARATDRYVMRGGGDEVFAPHFTFHGFRYVEVTGYPGEPDISAVTGEVLQSATPPAGSFSCSSDLVNRLQQNIVWGQRDNFLSVPTDCPQRDERLGWMGDAQIFVRTAAYNADLDAFFTKWMGDVLDQQTPEGAFPDVAPLLSERSREMLRKGSPAWGDAGVIVPWTLYKSYQDTGIVERCWDGMARWMRYLSDTNPGLLRRERLGNNYGDWLSPQEDRTPRELFATAYWAYDAALMAEMARATGREREARAYDEVRDGIRAAFVDAYVDGAGRLLGDTQTGYVLALHMDLLPPALRPRAVEHLVDAVEREDGHLATGFVGVGYLCPVLSEAGRSDLAYRLLTQETYPSWGFMIRNGATTIWERWDGWTPEKGFQSPNMNSFNHYSLGSVGEWLYRHVAGIDQEPGSAGFSRLLLRPQPGPGLTGARAEYRSVQGPITSAWRTDGDRFTLEVAVPPNTTATVCLPVDADAEVSEGEKPVEEAEGVRVLSRAGREVRLAVGSGTYRFGGRRPRAPEGAG